MNYSYFNPVAPQQPYPPFTIASPPNLDDVNDTAMSQTSVSWAFICVADRLHSPSHLHPVPSPEWQIHPISFLTIKTFKITSASKTSTDPSWRHLSNTTTIHPSRPRPTTRVLAALQCFALCPMHNIRLHPHRRSRDIIPSKWRPARINWDSYFFLSLWRIHWPLPSSQHEAVVKRRMP